ncbi:Low affinity vacuolar monovalent cation/H antiporter [Erysiphe neolycopersici]|uniref:Low affinity vacuolar monovalent cation/H antiporter n=1 Tax=Erysiphe neolycopersici TaxID=212602 RepID=A0A420HZ75_9PEZI|nr:Low affinity vacuolar monovalent cation/H antiporter [Erysiphe neolycopersici]
MSSLKSHVSQESIDLSNPPSPTDTRNPSVRWNTTTNQNKSQNVIAGSFQSTDTVRLLPEPISYGSINQRPQTPNQSLQAPSESSRGSNRRASKNPDTGRIKFQTSILNPCSSSRDLAGQKSKKPPISRKASTNTRAPYRGQEFSVDDDVSEVGNYMTKGSRRQSSTLRRRATVHQMPTLARLDSVDGKIDEIISRNKSIATGVNPEGVGKDQEFQDEEERGNENEEEETSDMDDIDNEDTDSISDNESFTLKDRQQAINETHPFGIRIWKPALYKKDRSVQKDAEGDIHSSPGGLVSKWLLFFNILWTVWFGWWLALVALIGAIVCFVFGAAPSALRYGRVLWGLSGYLFYPFGKFVRLEQDEAYAHEDEGEGRSITEYEQWQNGDLEDGRLFFGPQASRSIVGRSRQSVNSTATETNSLLGKSRRNLQVNDSDRPSKRRPFGRGQWDTGRVIFFLFFYGLITPLLIIVSGICWFLVFWIPMGKVALLLLYHLRRHPLALTFHPDSAYSRGTIPNSSILLCSYRAVGLKYWKYTIDGTNIFLINLTAVVLFVIFDYFILVEVLGLTDLFITHPAFLFMASLLSVIPLAYFVGQAVASISAQSSMGVGAAINAFFTTLVEVFLYCVALNQGKGKLVEGSIIGSIFAGVLFLPGISMCFGAIKRKTQRFNAKSASATSTMLLFAVVAAFGPTLFYQIYGAHELNCIECSEIDSPKVNRDCRRCYYSQTPSLDDPFFVDVVRPYTWVAAALLFLSYVIGLWFTLRTHASVIWNDADEKKVHDVLHNLSGQHISRSGSLGHALRVGSDSRVKEDPKGHGKGRSSGQSFKIQGSGDHNEVFLNVSVDEHKNPKLNLQVVHQPPPKNLDEESSKVETQNRKISEGRKPVTINEIDDPAVRSTTSKSPSPTGGNTKLAPDKVFAQKARNRTYSIFNQLAHVKEPRSGTVHVTEEAAATEIHPGGHDAPNWSRKKSSIVLFSASILYALIAEVLVGTVDVVLKNVSISEKFLGVTLFALVPNTTEFLNAISFAMNGNIALSMEIGSAYVLQVCLLQIPALVLYSAIYGQYLVNTDFLSHTFSLIFPQWDMITVTLCVFLLSYVYGEGKSNYFKGSILLLSYLVVIIGFWPTGFST